MKEVRIGIIGTGGIANAEHIPAYLGLADQGVRIAAICDIKPEAMEKTVGRYPALADVPRFVAFEKMLADAELDAVSVCTPNNAHMPATVAALRAGKHVLCEKPIARNAREGQAMMRAAKRYRRKLMIGLNNRWNTWVQTVKRAIDAGKLGEIYYARAQALRRREIPGWGNFIDKEVQGGGPLIDIGVHILDLTLYLMGFPEPVAVSAQVATKFGNRSGVIGLWGQWDPKKYTVEDWAVGFVRFANGASLVLEASFASNISEPKFESTLLGTKGGAEVLAGKLFTEEAGTLWDLAPYGLAKQRTHTVEIAKFVQSVREDKPVPVPAEEAIMTTRILDAMYRSAETGREVRLTKLKA